MPQGEVVVTVLAEETAGVEGTMPGTEQLVILLAEDDMGHATLVRRNLQRAGVSNQIVHVTDGQAALDFVRCQGDYNGRVKNGPLLVLLDINMPRLDGVEALRQLKADPTTQRVPVVMLTTTDDPREIARCYGLGCSVYVTKPVPYDQFVTAIQQLGLFLQIVQVPSEAASVE
jgi:CheY-like chemotaxis protein